MALAKEYLTLSPVGVTLSEKEQAVIDEIRRLPYGQIEVHMEDSQPVRIVTKESKKL
jgi:hypothetical protein